MNLLVRSALALSAAVSLPAAPGVYRISTFAGSSHVGDGGPAIRAALRDCEGVAIDRAGNLYLADAGDHRVRKITPAGTIFTVAGTGQPGFSGDNGPADAAQLNLPYGISLDAAQNLYIADLGNNRIRRVTPAGIITTLPGEFRAPRNVVADPQGNIYVSEFDANRIRRINTDSTVTLIAGTGVRGKTGDFGPAVLSTLNSPAGLAFDSAGALYVADSGNSVIRKIVNGTISTVLGTGAPGNVQPAQLNYATGVAFDSAGNLYAADSENHRIRKLAPSGTLWTIALPARDLAFDANGNLFAASGEHLVELLSSGATATVAGDGSYLYRGDNGPASLARLNMPSSVALTRGGAVLIADTGNGRVRSVAPGTGLITSAVAGPRAPVSLAVDAQANLLIADPPSAIVWKFAASLLSPAAGTGAPGNSGDNFPALSSALAVPSGVAAHPAGGFYLADTGNNRIRFVNQQGVLTTVAGTDRTGFNGDGIALGASLSGPTALALDRSNTLFIADTGNDRIRKLTSDGQIVTVVGGTGSAVTLNQPRGLTFDPAGTLWIADTGNHRLLALSPDSTLSVVAGTAQPGFSGDGADALNAQFSSPLGLASDPLGNIYVADSGNMRIRLLTAPPAPLTEAAPLTLYSAVGAASLAQGPFAPCSLVTVFGPDANLLPITFDGLPALPTNLSPGQATVQIPCSVTPPSTTLLAGPVAKPVFQTTLPIAIAAPQIFALNAGSGQALALNAEGTSNSDANPAAPGSILSLFVTGMGLPGNPSGVIVGQAAATILFAGDAPGLPGITQINLQLPPAVSGTQPVTVYSANTPSQAGVTLAISVH